MIFKKFRSIEQFRTVIKDVRYYCDHRGLDYPTLTFTGTVKLHGTNACIAYDTNTGERLYQSRERVLTPLSDNAGFCAWAMGSDEVSHILHVLEHEFETAKVIRIYGEWAGSTIQKGVGITNLKDKSFFIFQIEIDDVIVDYYINTGSIFNDDRRVYNISEFETYTIDINFKHPELSQNRLVELTNLVEQECPVAKAFGFSGIGEGIVWQNRESGQIFKVKGEKHSSSKVKTTKEIAAVDIEMINTLNEFVEYAVSENRLKQGIDKLRELGIDVDSPKSTGEFIKWVAGDVFKEEIDTITKNELDTKKLGPLIARKARQFFLEYINE
jgi:hypothetical protein